MNSEVVGFCPVMWAPDTWFKYTYTASVGQDVCSGVVDFGSADYFGMVNTQSGCPNNPVAGSDNQSRGEYVYFGPGVYGRYGWRANGIPTDLTAEQFSAIKNTGPATDYWQWAGVDSNGNVHSESNYSNYAAKGVMRAVIMGDTCLIQKAISPTEAPDMHNVTHPIHFKAPATQTNGGDMNYLYIDGSVGTYNLK